MLLLKFELRLMRMKLHTLSLFATATLIALNCVQGQNKSSLSAQEFARKMEQTKPAQLVDVRTPSEFADGHLLNARNFDWRGTNFEQQVTRLDKTKPVFVYCLTGGRSASAARKMRSEGFKEVFELQGGIDQWKAARLPTTTN